MKLFLVILPIIAISQICCVENTANNSFNARPENTDIVLDEQMEKNRKLWSASKISDYKFKLEVYETGLTGLFTDVEIKVRSGKAVDFNFNGNNQNTNNLEDMLAPYDTIEKLFVLIQDKFKKKQEYLDTGKPLVGRFNVSYDQKTGFPTEIKYNPFSGATDGDLYIKVKEFVDLTE